MYVSSHNESNEHLDYGLIYCFITVLIKEDSHNSDSDSSNLLNINTYAYIVQQKYYY